MKAKRKASGGRTSRKRQKSRHASKPKRKSKKKDPNLNQNRSKPKKRSRDTVVHAGKIPWELLAKRRFDVYENEKIDSFMKEFNDPSLQDKKDFTYKYLPHIPSPECKFDKEELQRRVSLFLRRNLA